MQEIEVPSAYTRLHLGWTPDGHALTYVRNTTGNTQNVYMQPLAGGAPVQLTHFDSEPALVERLCVVTRRQEVRHHPRPLQRY